MPDAVAEPITDTARYWRWRYRDGGDSGAGSAGDEAKAKAAAVARLAADPAVHSIVDWGCGDGRQLQRIKAAGALDDVAYTGVDVSLVPIRRCMAVHPRGSYVLDQGARVMVYADLALAFDTLYHFPDDDQWLAYAVRLFDSSSLLVAAWTTDVDRPAHRHMRHRWITRWAHGARPDYRLVEHPPAGDRAGLYVWRRRNL